MTTKMSIVVDGVGQNELTDEQCNDITNRVHDILRENHDIDPHAVYIP